jgi:hypothetical protein
VSGILPDPVLELHEGSGATVAVNDDWNASQAIPPTYIPPDSKEAVVVTTLQPGAYTAIERGKDSQSGVGLIEIYDLKATQDSSLFNISTRGFIGSGDNVMIAGFILGEGNGTGRVLVGALGPTLADFGVADAIQDTMIEIRDSNGTLVASNDDWKNFQEPEITAIGMAPPMILSQHYSAVVRQALTP